MYFNAFNFSFKNGQGELSIEFSFPNPGWSNPSLSAAVYVTPPQDGIQDIIFSATPPPVDQINIQPIQPWPHPVTANFDIADWFKGYRVIEHGEEKTPYVYLEAHYDFGTISYPTPPPPSPK